MRDFKNTAWPTPEEERARSWRHMSLLAQIVFFALTIVALSTLYGLFKLLSLPAGWITLAFSLAVGEWLIRRGHFWRTGVESALWIGGLYAFIFSLPSSGQPEALLVLAAAAMIAAWRVRQALFAALGLILIAAYFAMRHWPWAALVFSVTIALIAIFALARVWKRPSTELLWQVLLLVMPVAGYVGYVFEGRVRVFYLFIVLGVLCGSVGIHLRVRVPLVAEAICIAIAIIDIYQAIPLSLELDFVIGGAIALLFAAIFMRALRGKTKGFVIGEPKQSDLQAALSGVLSVHGAASGSGASVKPGGGDFGGAGASGSY